MNDAQTEKPCTDCGGQIDGKHPTKCNPCLAYRSRCWRKENPEKARAAVARYQKSNRERLVRNRRRTHLKSTYGITVEEYETIFEAQGGCCAICGTSKPNGPGNHFMVDHDHQSGKVRGLLCSGCNFVLGYAKEDTKTLEKAITYLTEKSGG